MAVVIEQPRTLFGRLVYGATIDGQTYWVNDEEELQQLIKELVR